MRHRWWTVAAAVAAVSSGLATASVGQAADAGTSGRAACADITFVGARGDAESATGHHGVGPIVARVGRAVAAKASADSMTMRWVPVRFRPASPATLVPSRSLRALYRSHPARALRRYQAHNVAAYDAGVAAAVSRTEQVIQNVLGHCRTQLVLAGFSQGAVVLHEVEMQLWPDFHFSPVHDTVLIADGDRNPDDYAGTRYGTAPATDPGVRTSLGMIRQHRRILAADVCRAGDLVCDFGEQAFLHPVHALRIHDRYAAHVAGSWTFAPSVEQAADWAATSVATAAIDYGDGSGQPPTTVGGFTMTPFGPDPQPEGPVTSVTDPAGTIDFGGATWNHQHSTPDFWASGGGFTDYYTQENAYLTIDLPAHTKAFYLYTGSDGQIPPFAEYFTLRVDGAIVGVTGADFGPEYFGFYALHDTDLHEITIEWPDLAVAGFGISVG
jgi:hypothetical protein